MRRKLFLILLIVLIVYIIFGVLTALSAKAAFSTGKKAIGAAKLQDLDATKAYLRDTKRDLERTRTILYVFTPLRLVPIFGWYDA